MVEMKTRNEVSSLLEPGRVRLKRGTVSFPQIRYRGKQKIAKFEKRVIDAQIPYQITLHTGHGLSCEAVLYLEEPIPE